VIYESAYPKFSIGRLDFTARVLKPGAQGRGIRSFFGELDSRKDAVRLVVRLGDPELNDKPVEQQASVIDKIIQADPQFLVNYEIDKKTGEPKLRANHAVGSIGIWLAQDRKQVAEAAAEKQGVISRFKNMGDAILRQMIVEAQMSVPTSASHEELVALAEEATDPNRPAAGEIAAKPQDGTRVQGPATRVATVTVERGQ